MNIKIKTVSIPMGFGWQPLPSVHQPSSEEDTEGNRTEAAWAPAALRLVVDTEAGKVTRIPN